MRPVQPTPAQVRELSALVEHVIPAEWEDHNGHVNVRHYMSLYDIAGWPLFNTIGIDASYFTERRLGMFDLEHHIRFLNEIRVGETVSLYGRLVARTPKRLHGFMFVLNDTRDSLASTLEFVSTGADLEKRRTEVFPNDIAEKIDRLVAESNALSWTPPACGAISP